MDETLALTLEKVDKPTGQVSAEHAFDDEVVELSLMKSEG
jgi:hypothetical protein